MIRNIKINSLSLLFACFFLLTSCKAILYKMNDITKPKDETPQSINNYLDKLKIDTSNNFIPKQEFYKQLIGLTQNSVPNALFFNKNGENVEYYNLNEKCTGKMTPFINTYKEDSIYRTNNINKAKSVLSLTNCETEKLDLTNKNCLIIFWMKPIGKLNETFTKKWEIEAKSKGFIVFKINLDTQKGWSEN